MHPFRVFLSYTAHDQRLLEGVVETLRDLGVCPWWDKKLGPGRLFLEEIRQRIATAHLFLPLLTPASSLRPWVQQETGFALGIDVPVLPIAVDTLPNAMLAGMQALVVREDLSDLKERLREVDLESIILPPLPRPPVLHSIADLPESRTEAIVAQGSKLVASVAAGRIRQRALFSLPSLSLTKRRRRPSGSTLIASNQEASTTASFRHCRRGRLGIKALCVSEGRPTSARIPS